FCLPVMVSFPMAVVSTSFLSFYCQQKGYSLPLTISTLFDCTSPYLGNLALLHYEHMFGKLPFPTWESIAKEDVSPQLMDNLKFMAYGGLEYCPACPICQQTGSLVP
ncbi:MAG: hypothetical protein V1737_05695, partial [Chloroflexota bacterium]